MFLAKMTTEQAAQAFRLDPVILLPVGSCEQHGPQCALGTDFLIPDHLARQVEALPNLIVAPTVPYGVCPYHMSFAGSIDIGYEGLHHLLHSITFSLMQHGARRFLILNGHGGNNPAIDKTALEIYHAQAASVPASTGGVWQGSWTHRSRVVTGTSWKPLL